MLEHVILKYVCLYLSVCIYTFYFEIRFTASLSFYNTTHYSEYKYIFKSWCPHRERIQIV